MQVADATILSKLIPQIPLEMDLDYFTRLRQCPVARLVSWLQHCSLLANPLHSFDCNRDMELGEREAEHIDGYQWFVSLSFAIIIYFVPFPETATKAFAWTAPEVFLDVFALQNRKKRNTKFNVA